MASSVTAAHPFELPICLQSSLDLPLTKAVEAQLAEFAMDGPEQSRLVRDAIG